MHVCVAYCPNAIYMILGICTIKRYNLFVHSLRNTKNISKQNTLYSKGMCVKLLTLTRICTKYFNAITVRSSSFYWKHSPCSPYLSFSLWGLELYRSFRSWCQTGMRRHFTWSWAMQIFYCYCCMGYWRKCKHPLNHLCTQVTCVYTYVRMWISMYFISN